MSKYRATSYRSKFIVEELMRLFTINIWLPCNEKGEGTLRETNYKLYDTIDEALAKAEEFEGVGENSK